MPTKVKRGMTRAEKFLDSSQCLISILYKIWHYLSVSHFCILIFWVKGELHCPTAKIKSSDSYIYSKQPANKGYVMYRLFHFVNAKLNQPEGLIETFHLFLLFATINLLNLRLARRRFIIAFLFEVKVVSQLYSMMKVSLDKNTTSAVVISQNSSGKLFVFLDLLKPYIFLFTKCIKISFQWFLLS